MGHTYRGGKSGCKMVTLFDSYSYDGVSAGIWVIHTYIHVCLYKFELTVAHLCPITACGMVSFGGLLSEQLPCFNTDSDNKEHIGGTIGQTKSLHGKPFPTASQLQGYLRCKEGWRHPLLGLIGVEDGECGQEGNLAQLFEEKLLRLDFDFELFQGVDD